MRDRSSENVVYNDYSGDGNWQQLATYFSSHSGAEFTHGICPSCSSKALPGDRIVNVVARRLADVPSSLLANSD